MENSKYTICRLCYSLVKDKRFEIIDEIIKNNLNVIFPKLNINEDTQNVMCKKCSSKLLEAFKFKSMCIETEQKVTTYVESHDLPLDLTEIYMVEGSLLVNNNNNKNICRLCRQLIKSKWASLEDVDMKMLQIYIPEVHLHITKNPVICAVCRESVKTYTSFIKECLDLQRIKIEYLDATENNDYFSEFQIKQEEIEIKYEESFEQEEQESIQKVNWTADCESHPTGSKCSLKKNSNELVKLTQSSTSPAPLKLCGRSSSRIDLHERDKTSSPIIHTRNLVKHKLECAEPSHGHEVEEDKYNEHFHVATRNCNTYKHKLKHVDLAKVKMVCNCSFTSRFKYGLECHKLQHADPSEIEMYECDECSFQTNYKRGLKKHKARHVDPSTLEVFKCDNCLFQTNYKHCLKTHKLRHADPSTIKMYKCNDCAYKSNCRKNLKRHKLRHTDPSMIEMYNCDECSFKTNYKNYLKTHKLRHTASSAMEILKCDKCSYQSNNKYYMNSHKSKHADPSTMKMYKCDDCPYQTTNKGHLNVHKLKHAAPSTIKMFKCDECPYQSYCRGGLKKHKLRHADPSTIAMYRCNECPYQSKCRGNLKKHKSQHADASTVVKYKCQECSFQTNYKYYLKTHKLQHADSCT